MKYDLNSHLFIDQANDLFEYFYHLLIILQFSDQLMTNDLFEYLLIILQFIDRANDL